MSGPSLYPNFMVDTGSGGGGGGDSYILVDGLNLVAANLAVTLAVEGPVKLLILPEDEDVLLDQNQTPELAVPGITKLEA